MKLLTVIGIVTIIALSSIFPFPKVASAIIPGIESTSSLSPYQQTWRDDFSSLTLDGRWSWVREDNTLWSLTTNPGYMQIISSGSLHETTNDQKNILLTPAPDGDFRITTRVQVSPTENYHGAALYVYQDDDNYIELTRIYNNGPDVALRYEIAGVRGGFYTDVTQDDILLRIVKEGNVYYGWLSEDQGVSWEYFAQISAAFSDQKVGLGVRMGPTLSPLTANFDWINLERIVYNTRWEDNFNLPDLDDRWSWVRENPSLWSLTANPGTMQITSDGSLHEDRNNQNNMLLTAVPGGDFRITTRVLVTPTENFHGAVLYVYQDDDNFVGVSRIYNNGPKAAIRTEVNGVPWSYYVPATQNDILLRIVKEGNDYFCWFSEDNGATWSFIYQFKVPLTNPMAGLSVRLGPTLTPLTANYDWINLESYMDQIFLPVLVR